MLRYWFDYILCALFGSDLGQVTMFCRVLLSGLSWGNRHCVEVSHDHLLSEVVLESERVLYVYMQSIDAFLYREISVQII